MSSRGSREGPGAGACPEPVEGSASTIPTTTPSSPLVRPESTMVIPTLGQPPTKCHVVPSSREGPGAGACPEPVEGSASTIPTTTPFSPLSGICPPAVIPALSRAFPVPQHGESIPGRCRQTKHNLYLCRTLNIGPKLAPSVFRKEKAQYARMVYTYWSKDMAQSMEASGAAS